MATLTGTGGGGPADFTCVDWQPFKRATPMGTIKTGMRFLADKEVVL
jgi:hypothetical protein